MSTNVYGPQNGPAPDFLRNVYDKQFQNLITTNFGDLRVCFCKEVLPGDSVNIDPVVAIRSQPIVFPIQTRMKFYCHFFYGRNRILMKNWEDFIFKTKDNIIPPLLKLNKPRAKEMISTGSLGDNLGIPSTIGIDEPVVFSYDVSTLFSYKSGSAAFSTFEQFEAHIASLYSNELHLEFGTSVAVQNIANTIGYFCKIDVPLNQIFYSKPFRTTTLSASHYDCYVIPMLYSDPNTAQTIPLSSVIFDMGIDAEFSDDGNCTLKYTFSELFWRWYSSQDYLTEGISLYIFKWEKTADTYFNYTPTSASLIPSKVVLPYITDEIIDATDDRVIDSNKFVGNNPTIPLSALPFRLYEFICNYYYRNDTNNPYILDGEPQYNKFIPTDDDGWDENLYTIHKRNWESDMFTTCVPSPQFGTAPLVGLTYNGGLTAEVTTNVTDSDGNTQSLGIQVAVDDDGNIKDIISADTGVPSGSLKSLMEAMSTTGISINTLRNVNSFQRFLENVIRRGLRYRNQLLSHFGVSVDYPDIDIPQFIGGFSGDLVVREVTNMAESSDVALGDVAGKIDAVIQSNHSINCYCAEHGFIMGIFCIVPVPTYSQVLPHMFTRYDAFDYFQKEFDKIGYVPVTYRNFLPLQSDDPDEVFGYQRAHFEYMSSIDEVHGDFRTSLDDFVLYRIFKEKPTLNETFLTVDSESLNNIFAVDKVEEKYKNADKFMCQFYFQYTQKTMIPKHGVASLE